ncbi:MAG: hypothetical protein ABI548_06715 [Polyangiaceae bacterium]
MELHSACARRNFSKIYAGLLQIVVLAAEFMLLRIRPLSLRSALGVMLVPKQTFFLAPSIKGANRCFLANQAARTWCGSLSVVNAVRVEPRARVNPLRNARETVRADIERIDRELVRPAAAATSRASWPGVGWGQQITLAQWRGAEQPQSP